MIIMIMIMIMIIILDASQAQEKSVTEGLFPRSIDGSPPLVLSVDDNEVNQEVMIFITIIKFIHVVLANNIYIYIHISTYIGGQERPRRPLRGPAM